MSSSTWRGACACRCRRRRADAVRRFEAFVGGRALRALYLRLRRRCRFGCRRKKRGAFADASCGMGERGFFLVEAVVLSFLVLACASAAFAYRALALGRAASAAETAAM